MNEIKKCPKCGGEMEKGKRMFVYGGVFRLTKKGDVVGDKVSPYYMKEDACQLFKSHLPLTPRTKLHN